MSLLSEYFKLYTDKSVVAMIMIILGVVIILYIIKKINQIFEPSSKDEKEEAKKKEMEEMEEVDEVPTNVKIWDEQDLKTFLRRDLIDHYAFDIRLNLFFPASVLQYQDNFTFNVRDDDAKINQYFVDIFQRQAETNPDGLSLFDAEDLVPIRSLLNHMIEELRDVAQRRLNSGYYGYAQFSGIHVIHTLKLPISEDFELQRTLEIALTLLCTDFTEPFNLEYKWKPRQDVVADATGEEEEQETVAKSEVADDWEIIQEEESSNLEVTAVSEHLEIVQEAESSTNSDVLKEEAVESETEIHHR
uniref:Uncharacterized protein n=1 Tax=Panagrolaimus sp. ES5 TaxID=591445 RepID=A0AC34F0R5_9BILA